MLDLARHTRRRVTVADRAAPPAHVLILIAALSAGVVAQGGYYLPGPVLVTTIVVAAT